MPHDTSGAHREQPRFCDQCAASLQPLPGPHVIRTCPECQKTIHVAEPGEDGKGIKVEKGDRFTIPAGSLTISLDPRKSAGRLYRPGLTWLTQLLLMGDVPKAASGVEELLDNWIKVADGILEGSALLEGYDLEDERSADDVIKLLSKDKGTVEFWAMAVGSFCHDIKEKLESGDTRETAFSAIRLATAWAMLVFIRDLEEHVWTGYKQNQLIYGIAQAGAQTPAEAQAIAELQPVFEKQTEQVLHAWVHSGVEIGPRLRVTGIDERILHALAEFHLNLFEQKRKESQLTKENRIRFWTLVGTLAVGSFTAGAAVTSAVVAYLKAAGVL